MARRRRGANNPLAVLMLAVVAAVLGVSLAGRDGAGSGSAPEGPAEATVVRHVDGDTLVVRIGGSEEPVRLIGIDTPESVANDQPVECFGPEAAKRLEELVPIGTVVRLERDVEPRDRYDRLLAYVYRVADNLFVNRDQVANGFAEASEYPPNTAFSADLTATQHQAQSAGAGMWSACDR